MSVNPQCQRCRVTFDTREVLRDHSETLHGDYQQALTQKEYLRFRRERGDDLKTAKQIPITNFMSVSKLKGLMREGKAESDFYAVRTGHGGRKPKKICAKCGEPFQATHGNQTRCTICRNPPKRVKKMKVAPKGRRRRRCAREKCHKLFQPKTQRGRRQIYCDDSCKAAAARDRRQGLVAPTQT